VWRHWKRSRRRRHQRHQIRGLDSPPSGALYVPWDLRPVGRGYLIARVAGDPMRAAPEIRRAASALDPSVPMPELQSLDDVLSRSIANRRARALPAVGFGILALCVALVGMLATLSTLVAERRRELAIAPHSARPPRSRLDHCRSGPAVDDPRTRIRPGAGSGSGADDFVADLRGQSVRCVDVRRDRHRNRRRRHTPLVLLKSE
jgi:hypothetical protein